MQDATCLLLATANVVVYAYCMDCMRIKFSAKIWHLAEPVGDMLDAATHLPTGYLHPLPAAPCHLEYSQFVRIASCRHEV